MGAFLVTFQFRLFAGSGHVVQNKLCWDANNVVGLPNQRKVGLDWYEFLCFESPTALFAFIPYHVIGSCKGPIELEKCDRR